MKDKILKTVVNFIKKNQKYPTATDLLKLEITKKSVEYHFGNLGNLRFDAYQLAKEFFFDLEKEEYKTTPKKTTKRFVITTSVLGGTVDKNALKNLNDYCKLNKAELIILPSVSNLAKTGWVLDPELRNHIVVTEDLKLNDNVFVLGIKNNAKSADPITGLPRIGQRNGTFISPSPKQRLKYVPTGAGKMPHALMTTGAITLPEYHYSGLMIDKLSYTASNDHVMGAIILEIEDKDYFHFRQIQFDSSGAFIDLGLMYKNGKVTSVKPSALVAGDWHTGSTDPLVKKCLETLCIKLKPECLIVHDLFDGISVNPHLENKYITKAKLANKSLNVLKNELDILTADVNYLSKLSKKLVIVASNHDDFINRYLEAGTYVKDAVNKRIALDMAISLCDGKNPLEQYLGKIDNVRWLKIDESYKVAGIECGMHGHLGSNGANPSIGSMETGYGKIMYGHTHSAQILRDVWNVGTSTYLDLGYNKGASSWTQTSGLIYPNGQRQLINFINGRYTA